MLLLCCANVCLQDIKQWAHHMAMANFESVLLQHTNIWHLD